MNIVRPKLWLYAKDYLFIIFGIAMYAFGFNAFIATAPEKVVIGGMAGVQRRSDGPRDPAAAWLAGARLLT